MGWVGCGRLRVRAYRQSMYYRMSSDHCAHCCVEVHLCASVCVWGVSGRAVAGWVGCVLTCVLVRERRLRILSGRLCLLWHALVQ